MKKIISTLFTISIIAGLILPLFPLSVNAQGAFTQIQSCTLKHDIRVIENGNIVTYSKGNTVNDNTELWGLICTLDVVMTIVDWIFWILLMVGLVFIAIGGFIIVTSAGDPGKLGNGRKYIMFGVIGVILAVFARAIPSLVKGILGV